MLRRLPFAGSLNFRDIGGYPAGGGQTNWGAVYRSDSLHFMTDDDLPSFDALGVKAIYDLRRFDELAASPGPREHIHIEIANRPFDREAVTLLSTRRDGEQWLLGDYRFMLSKAASSFGDLFSRLADPQSRPAVIHCVSGKDRTGLAVALLLTSLGVHRETVLDDYELTNDYRGAPHVPEVIDKFAEFGIAREAAKGMLSAPRWTMATALDELDERHGGVDGYLLGACGMSRAALRALRAALVS